MMVLLIIFGLLIIGTLIIVVYTIWQWRTSHVHSEFSVLSDIPGTGMFQQQLARQRDVTAALRIGIADLLEYHYRLLVISDDIDFREFMRRTFYEEERRRELAIFYVPNYDEAMKVKEAVAFDCYVVDGINIESVHLDTIIAVQESYSGPLVVLGVSSRSAIRETLKKNEIPFLMRPLVRKRVRKCIVDILEEVKDE